MQDEETLTEMGLVVDQWLRTAEIIQYGSIHQQSMNHISPPPPQKKKRKAGLVRYYAKSPAMQDVFWLIPGLISCVGVTGRWGLNVMYRMHGWPYLRDR